jgi:GlpG protein
MRQVGTLATQSEAQRFADYLVTLGIPSRVDGAPDNFSVWVIEENDVARAKQTLAEFQSNPSDPRYVAAQATAQQLRQDQAARQRQAQRRIVDLSQRWNAPLRRQIPVTVALIGVSIAATLLSGFGDPGQIMYWMSFSISGMQLEELRHGQLWRLWTPMFLHGSPMHLALDMYMFYQFGGLIEIRKGPWVLAGLVLATQVGADIGQVFVGQPNFIGFSGAVFGLFGYIWMKSRFDPAAGFYMSPSTVAFLLAWLVLGPIVIPNIANAAHIGGMAAGMVFGLPLARLRQ